MTITKAIAEFRTQLDALPQCVILAATKGKPEDELKARVRDILENGEDPVYVDGIESIDSVKLDGDALTGSFSDRIGVKSLKRIGFKITEDNIQTWILNPDEVAKFSVYQADVLALFAPMFGKGSKAGKKKKCTKGLACGGSCLRRVQSNGKPTICNKKTDPKTKAKVKEAKAAAGGGRSKDLSFDDFQKTLMGEFERIDKEFNHDGFVPIKKVRDALKGKVNREKFDEYLLEMQKKDNVQLVGGVPGQISKEMADSAIELPSTGAKRHYIQKGSVKVEGLTAKKSNNEISKYSDFKKEAFSALEELDENGKKGGLIRIHELREKLGDRVNRSDFNNWLQELSANDEIDLVGGEVPGLTSKQAQDSIKTPLGAFRYYVKLKKKK